MRRTDSTAPEQPLRRTTPPRAAFARAAALVAGLVAAAAPAAAAPVPAGSAPGAGANPPQMGPAQIDALTAQLRRHGLAEAPAKAPGVVRLATYNIHQLFDEADDPSLSGRDDDLNRAMPLNRRLATARAIQKVDADILALQEVESAEALAWYRDTYLEGMGYDHLASLDVGHSIGLEQAVLSRYPIVDARVVDPGRVIGEHPPLYRGKPNRFAGQPMTFRRPPLIVEIAHAPPVAGDDPALPESDRLTLVVVHLKTGDGSEDWRANEAKALAEIVGDLTASRPERRVAVLGAFAAPTSEGNASALLEAGLTDRATVPGQAVKGEGDAPARPEPTSTDGKRTDWILTNDAVPAGPAPFVLGTAAPPDRVSWDMAMRLPGFASDHYPLAVDLPLGWPEPRAGARSGASSAPSAEAGEKD